MISYNVLDNLVKTNENFNKSIQEYKEYNIISFTYRLPSYTDFLTEGALECRGTTFVEEKSGKISLFARPFEKFFNYKENPFTEEAIISKLKPISVTEKLDGSLIMCGVLPNGELIAKTKSTILSEQAKRATIMINRDAGASFCRQWITKGYTPLFEYCSPDNRIVLFYPEEKLTLIGLRNMETGEYHNIQNIKSSFPVVQEYPFTLENIKKLQETGKNEGYVVVFE